MPAPDTMAAPDPSRRELAGRLLGGMALATAGLLAWRFAAWAPARRTPVLFPPMPDATRSRARRVEDVILVQQGGRAWALSARCTHLGCAVGVAEDGQTLSCPCHGSRYTLEGQVLRGPATDPLPRLSHTLAEDGSHVVERS